MLFLLLLCVFVLGDLADTRLIAMITPTVTVTIVPETHTVTTIADHQPGDEATHVKITVAETCTTGAYNQQAVQVQGEQLLNVKAQTLGKGYRLVGDIRPTILAKQGAASIRMQFTGTYLYQINQQTLTTLIAGQPKHHALLLLAGMAGIQHATIAGLTDDNLLPLDSSHIHVMLLYTVW